MKHFTAQSQYGGVPLLIMKKVALRHEDIKIHLDQSELLVRR